MSGDVLTKRRILVAMGAYVECDVLTYVRGSITDISPNIERYIVDNSGINLRYIGLQLAMYF